MRRFLADQIGPYGELKVVVGKRVKLRTYPRDRNHRKIRKIADRRPYYMVEDRYGNTGMYRLDQMEHA